MQTSIDIPDATYDRIKRRAESAGSTVDEFVVHAVESVLREVVARNYLGEIIDPRSLGPIRKLTEPPMRGGVPDSVHLTNEMIDDLLYGS